LNAKAKLLNWADEHDARPRSPWRLIGTLAAGAAIVIVARAVLPGRRKSIVGSRASVPLIGRAARPIMRLAVAARVGYWFWTQLARRMSARASPVQRAAPGWGPSLDDATFTSSPVLDGAGVPPPNGKSPLKTRSTS